jgi:hypothetical protein
VQCFKGVGGGERLSEVCFKVKSFCDREKIARNLLAPCTLYGLVFVPVCILEHFVNMKHIFFTAAMGIAVGILLDPDPDRVGSASFCRIRIGFQGMPIRIRIGINASHMKKLKKYTFFHKSSICCPKYLKL